MAIQEPLLEDFTALPAAPFDG